MRSLFQSSFIAVGCPIRVGIQSRRGGIFERFSVQNRTPFLLILAPLGVCVTSQRHCDWPFASVSGNSICICICKWICISECATRVCLFIVELCGFSLGQHAREQFVGDCCPRYEASPEPQFHSMFASSPSPQSVAKQSIRHVHTFVVVLA